jgi:hypothetical protein
MKPKSLAAPVLAALAISGLFAVPASAEETSRLTICGNITPADEAHLASHDDTREELRAAWQQIEDRYCASVIVPSGEMHEVSNRIARCWEERTDQLPENHPELEKAAAGECIAAWGPNGTEVAPSRHKKKKRVKKHSDKAKIALAQNS